MPEQSSLPQWRERLRETHRELQRAMHELIQNKNYSAAEMSLSIVDKDLLKLIEEAGGLVVRSSD